MEMFSPFIVKFYWGGKITYTHRGVTLHGNTREHVIIMTHRMSYTKFLEVLCRHAQIDRNSYSVKLKLHFTFQGVSESSYITGDDSMSTMFYLALNLPDYVAHIHVQCTPLFSLPQGSAMDLLRRFSVSCQDDNNPSAADLSYQMSTNLDLVLHFSTQQV